MPGKLPFQSFHLLICYLIYAKTLWLESMSTERCTDKAHGSSASGTSMSMFSVHRPRSFADGLTR